MSLISHDVAIIMLVIAGLGIIGVFPLISSALVVAQAVQWLQRTSKTAIIYKLAIAAIVFASLELLAVMGVAAVAAKFYPAFNFAIIFGSANLGEYKNPDGSIDVHFKSYSNLCNGLSLSNGGGSSISSPDMFSCVNGIGSADGFFLWFLIMSAFNISICVANITWSSLAIIRIKAASVAASAGIGGAYSKVGDGPH